MATPDITLDALAKPAKSQRVARYKVWQLQKRLAELSAQVETCVLEARQLVAWKQTYQPLVVAELTDEDRRVLDSSRRSRLIEVVQKHCIPALKSITQHKWAFPFNSPVDTTRFPDYPKVVANPMDFSTIKARQDAGYYRDPKDWYSDLLLVFSNAKRYNAPGSDCHLMAQTLQEVAEEKWEKLIGPRLAEEAAAGLREEGAARRRRAEALNAQVAEAMEAQAGQLIGFVAELHGAIREAKSVAACLCEPLTLEEKQALAAGIQGLPTAQLEAIVAFVAARHPAGVSQSEPAQPAPPQPLPGGGSGGGAGPGPGGGPAAAAPRKVQLNLGRYDPLLLRQLQHMVATCNASGGGRGEAVGGAGGQGPAGRQRAASGGGASPGASPGSAGQAAGVADGPAGQQQQGQGGSPAAGAGAARQEGAQRQSPEAQGVGAGGAAAHAPASTQRNISDVVTNATASGISLRAGIRWPGQAVGAGIRARARALLPLPFEGAPSPADMAAACPLPAVLDRAGGLKRRAQEAVQEDCGREAGSPQRGRGAGGPAAPQSLPQQTQPTKPGAASPQGGPDSGGAHGARTELQAGGGATAPGAGDGAQPEDAHGPGQGAGAMDVDSPAAAPGHGGVAGQPPTVAMPREQQNQDL